jgi:hypothetical protein
MITIVLNICTWITVRTAEEVEGGGTTPEEVRHYYLKREYSESSFSVKPFKFPLSALMLDDNADDVADNPLFRYDLCNRWHN